MNARKYFWTMPALLLVALLTSVAIHPAIAQKLLNVVNGAAYRGVLFGIIVGTVAMSLRLWLGMEETMYRGTESR